MSMKGIWAIVLGLVLVATVFTFSISMSPVDATTGTLVVSADTTLTENHNGNIVIDADGVTLDCAGFSVTGSGSGSGIVLATKTGVTVKNCNVTGFIVGIFLLSFSNSNTLTDNTASNNSVGILLGLSSGNTLTDNTASNNNIGIRLFRSSGNTLTDNTASNNGIGFFVVSASDANQITSNFIAENEHGINICLSLMPPDNTIFPNKFKGPQQAIFVDISC